MSRDNKLVVLAVALLVVAGLLIARSTVWNPEHQRMVTKPANVEKRIAEIQNDPHMPQFAKDIAIGQLRSRQHGGAPVKTTR